MKINAQLTVLSCVLAGVFSASVCAATVNPVTGSLKITGNVVDATCEVPAAQLTRTINVPEIDQSVLTAAGKGAAVTGASTAFQFDVTKCPTSVKRVGVRFDYTGDTAFPALMKNTGTAKGVLLGISKDTDTTAITTGTSVDAASIANGAATVKAKVNAYRTTEAVVAGDIASTATVTVNYD
ncbi:type 1 fimbrial protein [Salmonella enterica]|nr:type 1 fimbrial protein [Salmonella enterica]